MKSAEAYIGAYPHLLEPRHFRSNDGSTLQYFDSGADKPILLLANGLGGPCVSFRPLASELRDSFRLVSWDYRGLYGSARANREDLSVERHAADAVDLLRYLGEERAFFLGWSMGVQVGLELAMRLPSLSGLILLSGTVGTPLRTFPFPFAKRLRHLFPLLGRSGPAFRAILADGSLGPAGFWLAKRLRLVAPTFADSHFDEMRAEFSKLDFEIYFLLLEELCRHDASRLARQIQVPALVLTGGSDQVTPPSAGRDLANLLVGAEYAILPGATHYAAVEFPKEIAELVGSFCAKITTGRLTSVASNGRLGAS